VEKLRTLDLFSGIGGFTLGLDSTGYFETVAFCEIEAFPCKILNKHWPDVPIYNDVRELNHERLQTDGIISGERRIDVICGGYPCQPFSVAGHQKGEADKRHLWPEYFRLVRELRPRYAIGENVGGHLRLGLDSVLEDLDSEDYTVRCFSVEAASLGAPHRRERIFWIADRNPNGSNVDQKQKVQERASAQSHGTCDDRTEKTLADTESRKNYKRKSRELGKEAKGRQSSDTPSPSSSQDVGNTECNGSSAPEIGGGNTKTPGRTAQGKGKTLEPTGTGGSGDNEDVADSGSGGIEFVEIHRGSGQGRQPANPPESELLRQKDGTPDAERTGTGSKYVSDSESERHRGGHREECGTEQRLVLKAQQTGSEMGSETQGCGESSGRGGEEGTEKTKEGHVVDANGVRLPQHPEAEEESSGRRTSPSPLSTSDDVADALNNGRNAKRTDQETRGTLGGSEEGRMLEPEGSGSRSEVSGTGKDAADSTGERLEGTFGKEFEGLGKGSADSGAGNDADTHSEGLEGTEKARNSEEERTLAEHFTARQGAQRSEEERRKTTFESYLGGGNDGISAWLDGSWERGIPRVAPSNKLRVPRLKALGNAVLPQLVYMVGMTIVLSTKSSENEEESGG